MTYSPVKAVYLTEQTYQHESRWDHVTKDFWGHRLLPLRGIGRKAYASFSSHLMALPAWPAKRNFVDI
ncbi:hypothetical protein C2W62_42730 [Candidatus Entotheonella serta]|nr:hypothetical protein C2W62_42730 [Candidatus Entotheonella serta]